MIYKCKKCGSTNIQIRAWVGANDNSVHDWCDEDGLINQCWCEDCQEITDWVGVEEIELIPTDQLTEDNIESAYVRLVKKYGSYDALIGNELYTFDYCSDNGLSLADSTIDKILVLYDGQVMFIYNQNINDTDMLTAFDFNDLKKFYDGLLKVLTSNPQ